jgi:type IV pilus assembly protein PilV
MSPQGRPKDGSLGAQRQGASSTTPLRSRGFTLIEVLVTLIVTAIGLLGVAKMQALAIISTRTASVRSIASIQAASMAAAMHANRAYWASGVAPSTAMTITGSTLGDSTLNSQSASLCQQSPCTPLQMAGYDLKNWGLNIPTQLPQGTATVSCTNTAGSPVSCTLTVLWNENYVGMNSATVHSNSGPVQQQYTLLVEP